MNKNASVSAPMKAPKEVVSKYFKPDTKMDDSTSDFQEPKKIITNNIAKQSNNKPKRKTTKKVKGQKDIRTILNKKNDLVNYSKDFDTVCKQTGIDVDSEQLQLAIAMSKSLQDSQNETKDIMQNPTPLSSHGRAERIKNNLLKFGFKIPDVNINLGKNKKNKKIRKHSKLLTITDAERKQIIIDKYTSIVMMNLNNYSFKNNNENSLNRIYNLATNTTYVELKHLEIFYTYLIEPSSNSTGSLLKDWSKIPGRPSSPKIEAPKLKLIDLDLTNKELDMILSKELSIAQSIVKDKYQQNRNENHLSYNHEEIFNDKDEICTGAGLKEKYTGDGIVVKDVRTPSPDLFDDETTAEESKIIISSNESKDDAVQNNLVLTSGETNNIVDLVDKATPYSVTKEKHNTNKVNVEEKENIIEKIDLTQSFCERKEINEVNNDGVDAMDLTQSSISSCNDSLPEVVIPGLNLPNPNLKHSMKNEVKNDVTQIEQVEKKNHDFDEYVFEHSHESDEAIGDKNKSQELVVISDIDLTQNSKSSNKKARQENTEKRCSIDIDLTQNSSNDNYDCQIEEYNFQKHDYDCQRDSCNSVNYDEASIDYDDLNINKSISHSKTAETNLNLNKSDTEFDKLMNSQNTSAVNTEKRYSSDIDLTQHSSNDDYDNKIDDYDCQNQYYDYQTEDYDCQRYSYNSVKNDEVSMDYDDLNIKKSISNSKTKETNINPNTSDIEFGNIMKSQNSQESFVSQRNEIFEISDEELNYSMRKSTYIDSTPSKENYPENTETQELEDQYFIPNDDDSLPAVEIQGRKVKLRNSQRKTNNDIIVHTPNNSEYVFKTHDVTPMQNYESMTTPERNKELDKYGLKPFKRKRAIQLLTHLYNQTHPIVDDTPDDLPSPSKRRRSQDTRSTIKSPILSQKSFSMSQGSVRARNSPTKKLYLDAGAKSIKLLGKSQKSPAKSQKSPAKSQKSPAKSQKILAKSQKSPAKSQKTLAKSQRMQVEEDPLNYEITRECPLIKDIYCSEEDWVFQKREKAKLHSCRVPLHIAFHNYVSCRQGVREAILRYEPINIDVIHKDLANDGHRYDPKDLLKYLDKKCVTVKTNQRFS